MIDIALQDGLHQLHRSFFGSTSDLIRDTSARDGSSLMIACWELGSAPDNVSFTSPGSFVTLQHLGASVPSQVECEMYPELSFDDVEELFDEYVQRFLIKVLSGVQNSRHQVWQRRSLTTHDLMLNIVVVHHLMHSNMQVKAPVHLEDA